MKMAEVRDQLAVPISTQTARQQAHKLGFKNRVAVKKPFLTKTHKRCRLQFAKRYNDCTPNSWRKIVWTNESSFEIGKISRQVVVWRKPKDKYKKEYLTPTFKSGQTSTMVWGAFFGATRAPLTIIPPGQQKAAQFIKNVYEKALKKTTPTTNSPSWRTTPWSTPLSSAVNSLTRI
jgi:hypothetical protein